MPRDRFKNTNTRERLRKDRDDYFASGEHGVHFRAIGGAVNVEHKARCVQLLEEDDRTKDMCPGSRKSVESWLAWLGQHPNHCLAAPIAARMRALEAMQAKHRAMRARGVEPAPFVPDRNKSRGPIRRSYAPRPAWMSDPSLLPKRPPGAPQQ